MILSIILVIIFLSILVLVHELGHFLFAKKFGLWVEEFGVGLPPRLWGKKIGETLYSLNALPIGGFVKIYGEDGEENEEGSNSRRIDSTRKGMCRSFTFLPIWKRSLVLVAGVLMNVVFGWLLVSIIFAIGIPQSVVVVQVVSGTPAEKGGLVAGDRILGGESGLGKLSENVTAQSFTSFIGDSKGKEIVLRIERQGQMKEVRLTPRVNPPPGEGALGVGLTEAGLPQYPLLESFWEGLKTTFEILEMIVLAIFNLIVGVFAGKASLSAVAGPVGIVKITAQAGGLGFVYLLQLLALISLNLAVINIFPFPALDGGRLLFLFVEKIKGSPLPRKFERYANRFGMALLLILMAVITIRDIASIFK